MQQYYLRLVKTYRLTFKYTTDEPKSIHTPGRFKLIIIPIQPRWKFLKTSESKVKESFILIEKMIITAIEHFL